MSEEVRQQLKAMGYISVPHIPLAAIVFFISQKPNGTQYTGKGNKRKQNSKPNTYMTGLVWVGVRF